MMDATDWGRIKAKISSPMTSDRDKEIYRALWDLREGALYASERTGNDIADTAKHDEEEGQGSPPEGSERQGEDPQAEASEAPKTVIG